MSDSLLFEPRSLWSIANALKDPGSAASVVDLPKQHFFNGTRWPIVLERLALAGVNYLYMGDTPARNESSAIINRVSLDISVPQRYHVNSKRTINCASLCPRPTWTPKPVNSSDVSSLWGQSMLTLPQPLRIPKDGDISWDLSNMSPWVLPAEYGGGAQAEAAINAYMLYQETGGTLFPGSARTFKAQLFPMLATSVPVAGTQTEERWPYPPDIFGGGVYATGATGFWDPRSSFTARNFKQQNPVRDGSAEFTDLRVMIEQINYDQGLLAGSFEANQPSPLSLRVGTRIKTNNCGSQAWWWRPGAPLALVFDTITPACVYDLQEPITLQPGDSLNVRMSLPSTIGGKEETETPFYIGVSFNGYSVIEG